MQLFFQPDLSENHCWLTEEESRHCVKVLRKREGEAIVVTDGCGFFYDCIITKANTQKCEFKIQEKRAEPKKLFRIHLAIAPTKNPDRLEWLVEKATELGVDEITLIDGDHSERSFIKTERLLKVAISAMKQSQKATLPIINPLKKFSSILDYQADQKFIAYVDHSNPKHLLHEAIKEKSYLICIGPEGDFSQAELASAIGAGFVKVSLGDSRLRTETAGMAACCLLNAIQVSV
ncbi:16S rRNA (uracil(1498)-N(3))-methyltransferase [Chryseotalea sanaruensis]|uniref:Ribosomal RNA small subunit methyltransferase E n=1 Tax=Chryseotalea sanaruensis TaxID=2482724 RepID=A0A401UDQ7_9BACT|nr:16S rRNA (uracil(1498)-N(3))-methyltransferase [Chryseotalea sanaruensis]GCC52992.1 16S rRNA (uracil(1498)-N(3))-methyltransferase [Chryseotalea sanaruensis]